MKIYTGLLLNIQKTQRLADAEAKAAEAAEAARRKAIEIMRNISRIGCSGTKEVS